MRISDWSSDVCSSDLMSVDDHRSAISARRPESDSMKKRRLQAAESLLLGKTAAGTQASTAAVEAANALKACAKPVTDGAAPRRDDDPPRPGFAGTGKESRSKQEIGRAHV